MRVVTLPSVHGEAIVHAHPRQGRGVTHRPRRARHAGRDERERFERAIDQPYGAVLVTGPTGSGKSTTLYAALSELNTPEKNIITIEDPVEYQLDGITQVQVNPRAGLTFATGLRSMMRADPDVIMVGEIRDRETAQIAIESALTGHLVLSTLHTNDAPTAITRLIEMGIEPFLVASRDRLRRRPAARAHALPALQGARRSSPPTSCASTASTSHSTSRPTSRAAAGAAAARLQGPDRPLRGDDRSPRRSAS